MSKIPYTIRRNGRYYFRRRFRWHGHDYVPVISLETFTNHEARSRASLLAMRFETIKMELETLLDFDEMLTPKQVQQIFELELKATLQTAIEKLYASDRPAGIVWHYRTCSIAFEMASRPYYKGRFTQHDAKEFIRHGATHHDLNMAEGDIHYEINLRGDVDIRAQQRVDEVGGDCVNVAATKIGTHQVLKARAEAFRIAAHFLDDKIYNSSNPLQALLELRRKDGDPFSLPVHLYNREIYDTLDELDAFEKSLKVNKVGQKAISNKDQEQIDCLDADECKFETFDHRRFSEIIEPVIESLKFEKRWKGNCNQQRRIMRTFAWMTGDRRLGEYTHRDVRVFKEGLRRLPRTFRFADHWHRPFSEVLRDEKLLMGAVRSPQTVNRDLSTMSTVAGVLEEDEWRPKIPGTPVLNFAKATSKGTKRGKTENERVPWSIKHMERLFTAPIWTGGGGKLARLRQGQEIWQDAAYWVLPLLYYTHTALNEIAGLKTEDVVLDGDTPYLIIRNNDLRGIDGELAGEKTENRGRMIPLHDEILRLGFPNYVRAIIAEKSEALFPELYEATAKRGGDWFRERAFWHMRDWLGLRMDIPSSPSGKNADLHSIRTLSSSNYAQDGVLDLMRADVMGHARSGTNALHYSKRWQSEGPDKVLPEYKEFMAKWTPIVTSAIIPAECQLLPVQHRSRTGKP